MLRCYAGAGLLPGPTPTRGFTQTQTQTQTQTGSIWASGDTAAMIRTLSQARSKTVASPVHLALTKVTETQTGCAANPRARGQ